MMINPLSWGDWSVENNESALLSSPRNALLSTLNTIEAEFVNGIVIYSIILVVGGLANILMLIFLLRQSMRVATMMNTLLLQLCVADTVVIFSVVPTEIVWRLHVGWPYGNFSCKLVQYLRAFGLYLSSWILISICMNRYHTIVQPEGAGNTKRRIHLMIAVSWIAAAICSAPQLLIFQEMKHPRYPRFHQCLSNALGESGELFSGIFSMICLYFLPLATILFSYGTISQKILQDKAETGLEGNHFCPRLVVRSNWTSTWDRARTPTTLKAVGIVVLFLICWTPYVVVSMWDLFHRHSLQQMDPTMQNLLLAMILANSTLNPVVYGCLTQTRERHVFTIARETNRFVMGHYN